MRTIQGPIVTESRWQRKGGWEGYEGEGVCPVYCGERAREAALSDAQQRAGYAATEIEVLDAKWNVTNVIPAVSGHGLI